MRACVQGIGMDHRSVMKPLLLAVLLVVLPIGAEAQTAPAGPPAVGVVRVARQEITQTNEFIGRIQAVGPGSAGRPGHRVSRKAALCRRLRGQEGRSALPARAAAVSGPGRRQQGQRRAARSAAPQRRADARARAIPVEDRRRPASRRSILRSPRSALWRRRSPARRRSWNRPRSISATPRSARRSTARSAAPR